MKKPLYDKMKAMFPLIGHDYREIGPLEDLLYRLALGNTFTSRIVGLDAVKRFRQENPGCAITFKPNHLSEADFIVLAVLFRTNGMRVVIEGGNNLFIDTVDIFRDVLPGLLNPAFAELAASHRMSIADYLTQRGSFKVFRNPITVTQPDGTEVKLGRKDILSLSRAYRQHLVEEKEMYLTFPGFSTVRSSLLDLIKMDGVKTGRTYTGRIDGFHHLPFQMDIEAAVDSGVDVCIVPVNLAYERVMEDENFQELTRMHEAGVDPQKIYFHDMGYIIRRFCADKRKVDLSIKFGEPRRVDGRALKSDMLGTKIKFAAHAAASSRCSRPTSTSPPSTSASAACPRGSCASASTTCGTACVTWSGAGSGGGSTCTTSWAIAASCSHRTRSSTAPSRSSPRPKGRSPRSTATCSWLTTTTWPRSTATTSPTSSSLPRNDLVFRVSCLVSWEGAYLPSCNR